jgi:hypothetical protein
MIIITEQKKRYLMNNEKNKNKNKKKRIFIEGQQPTSR